MITALQRAAQIATRLEGGGTWTAASDSLGSVSPREAELRGPDGMSLALVERADGYVNVSWRVPHALDGYVPDGIERRHEINMSGSKNAEAMATEITRRLLPPARASLAAIQTHKIVQDTVAANRMIMVDRIRTALDITPTEFDRQGNLHIGQFGGDIYGTVEVTRGDHDVIFSITVTHTLALAIAGAIGKAIRTP
ncbi:hypothetical protein [Pseudonocardia acaciae]|uniref:hypothetical protein n=1 Tax=Pseudonocardia acaciae TaxID=551276 RepID=UPI00048AB0E9|nr:hypothetical protein [Pseudonocardia acaciae]